ncbi:MAG TPA: biopolymer transporter ExbD [bacterium]|nr:biopolymer transporter ExbD [bacterium]
MIIPSPVARRRARLEIIPLIDVMFFLLATFIMVSLSMIQDRSIPVNLPGARSSQASPEKAAVILAVTKEGKIFWNKEALDLKDLPARLQGLVAADPDPKVMVHGDKAADFGTVVSVLDDVRKAGVKRTAIRTQGK